MDASVQPQRERQVIRAIARIQSAMDQLELDWMNIIERVKAVRMPKVQAPEEDDVSKVMPECPVADQINTLSRRIERLSEAMRVTENDMEI